MGLDLSNDHLLIEVVPPLTKREATEEALRCYFCYDAPCITACPTGIDIPGFINHIVTGDLKGSVRTIMDANILGATCARICPTEALCEGSCVRVHDSRPVSIGRLQRVAMDHAMATGVPELPPLAEQGSGNIAVIGSGPAGLGSASYLRRMGYTVDVYEQREAGGGLDTYGIVSYREPLNVSLFEVEAIKRMGVTLRRGLEELSDRYPVLGDVRGKGLMQGIELVRHHKSPAADLAAEFLEQTRTRSLLLGKGGLYGNIIRIAPPMTVTPTEVHEALHAMDEALASLYHDHPEIRDVKPTRIQYAD